MRLKALCKNEKGQAMVEFALVVPLLLLLLGGIMDFGWIYYNQISVNNAAREGARYASIHYNEENAGDVWKTKTSAQVKAAASSVTNIAIQTENTTADVKVTVTAQVPYLTGIASTVTGKPSIALTASSVMKIEN